MIIIDNHHDERHAHGLSISLCVCTMPPSPTYPPARGGAVSEKLLRTPLPLSNQHDDDDEKPQITKKSSDYDNHHDYDDDDDDLIMMINPSTQLTPNLNPSLHMA